MRPCKAAVSRWSSSGLLSRILRGPVPFEVASVRSRIICDVFRIYAAHRACSKSWGSMSCRQRCSRGTQSQESAGKLRAASERWQQHIKACIQRDPGDPYVGLLVHALGSEDEAKRLRTEQRHTWGPIPGVISLDFLRSEAKWRTLPPHKLWNQFQGIAWGLHDEVNRVAYNGTLPGRGKLLFVLTSGHEFADGDAGGLCLGSDSDGVDFRPFAVIGVTRQWHASYEALKETVLHELAHWAAHCRHGHWQHLGPSEVATCGHGDYWRGEVARIQGVFGDFVGFRFLTAAGHEQTETTAAGDLGLYMHTYVCGVCGQRSRYASRSSEHHRRCHACGVPAMAYIGRYDELSQPYTSQRNAAWRAYVSQNFTAVFARLTAQGLQTSNLSVPDTTQAVEEARLGDSLRIEHTISDSEAARLREQALQELSDKFSNKSVGECQQQGETTASVALEQPSADAPLTSLSCYQVRSQPTSKGEHSSDGVVACTIQDDSPSANETSISLTEILGEKVTHKAARISAAAASIPMRQRANSGNSRMLIRRSVGGAALSPNVPDKEAESIKNHSHQQRQWYLFQRAAWAEARRQVQDQSDSIPCNSKAENSDAGGTGAVQRLVAAWWHEYKNEMMPESNVVDVHNASADGSSNAQVCSHQLAPIAVAEAATKGTVLTQSSCKRNSRIDPGAKSQVTRIGGTSTPGTSTSKNSGVSSAKHADELEQFARTARYVWSRFGARAWESQLTNDEARALYRAWT